MFTFRLFSLDLYINLQERHTRLYITLLLSEDRIYGSRLEDSLAILSL